ncbi:MAG: CRISPR-associated protein Csx15 [Anaerolineae bacterium]
MILLNFSHPLTTEHLAQIEALAGNPVERVIDAPTQFDHEQPFVPQVRALVDSVGLSSTEWQTLSLLVNPPALNLIAVTLLAELHGRMGYFPTVLRLRPVPNSTPPRFEVAELINLQDVRATARTRR